MTYCIVNTVIAGTHEYEQFTCIGIPDRATAKALLAGINEYSCEGNTFNIKEEPYKLWTIGL